MYLLYCILDEFPDSIYIHAKKTISDAKGWFKQWTAHWDAHEMLDMTGLDGSVRGGAVNMMRLIMHRYGVPQEDIEEYVRDKRDFHTRTRTLALMTLSGEIFTYLINTLFCLSRECLKYALPKGCAIAQTGDDTDRQAGYPVSEDWVNWAPYDHCVEKRYESRRGSFASFNIYQGCLYKDPVILLGRLLGQLERGNANNIALGYFELFSHNYVLADTLYDVMDSEELEHQNAINDVMFHWRRRTKDSTHLPWEKLALMEIGVDSLEMFTNEYVEQMITIASTSFTTDELGAAVTADYNALARSIATVNSWAQLAE